VDTVTAAPVPRDWWDTLREQTWPHGQQLTEAQIDRLDNKAGTLDMDELVQDFCDYWAHNFTTLAPSRLKTWVLPLRLGTWIRNAQKRQPAPENRSDEYLQRLLQEQRERGNR